MVLDLDRTNKPVNQPLPAEPPETWHDMATNQLRTPAALVARVVRTVRGGHELGGGVAIVSRPARTQAGWGGLHQGDQQPADLGHRERKEAELAGQVAASAFVPSLVVALVRMSL
jgi:hypothetical protein